MEGEREARFEKAIREFDQVYKEWRRFLEYAICLEKLAPDDAKQWRLLCEKLKEAYDRVDETFRSAVRWEWGD